MKKTVTIFLAFIVALSSVGFSLTIEYCPMADSHTFSISSKAACCCKTPDGKNCCTTHKISIKKVDSKYLTSTSVSISSHSDFVVFENCVLTQNQDYSIGIQNIRYQNFDPPEPHVPLNILFRSILV